VKRGSVQGKARQGGADPLRRSLSQSYCVQTVGSATLLRRKAGKAELLLAVDVCSRERDASSSRAEMFAEQGGVWHITTGEREAAKAQHSIRSLDRAAKHVENRHGQLPRLEHTLLPASHDRHT
jgi:hypothetical protein